MTDLHALDTIVVERLASWRHRAACRGVDPALFYPAGWQGRAALDQIARAKAVCAACPVSAQCHAEADAWGIWAGTTPWERGHRRHGRRHRAKELVRSVPQVAAPAAPVPALRPGWGPALRTLARHGRVALRSRTDLAAGVISYRAGSALRDAGLIERDRALDLTGACWSPTPAGRALAAELEAADV